MPATSKAQQRFMGMVLNAKRGGKPASKEVADAADSMTETAVGHFAGTKTKGLPKHTKKSCDLMLVLTKIAARHLNRR